jgi:hypothetical protein
MFLTKNFGVKSHQIVRDILLSRDNLLSPTKGLGPFSRDVGDLFNTCSWCPYEPAAHALHPWYYTTSREQRRVCRAKIEQVVTGGGPSGVLLRGKGIENHSGLLGTI